MGKAGPKRERSNAEQLVSNLMTLPLTKTVRIYALKLVFGSTFVGIVQSFLSCLQRRQGFQSCDRLRVKCCLQFARCFKHFVVLFEHKICSVTRD